MGKNVLVITGSPRREGNSALMAQALVKGAESAGHSVSVFHAAEKQIGGCRACDACWSGETACVFQDGFTELEPLLEAADVVVYASPLYWFGLSAQIKPAIDRLYAYMSDKARRKLHVKRCALLMSGGDSGEKFFRGAVETYRNIAEYLGWEDAGMVVAGGVSEAGAVRGTGALAQAEALGRSL